MDELHGLGYVRARNNPPISPQALGKIDLFY
jgi:hypothetical protein